MAAEAIGSRYTIKTNYLIAAACMAFALWFLYDGWFNEEFQNENTEEGKPNITLQLNRTWLPIICGLAMACFASSAVRLRSRKIRADDKGLALSTGQEIPYESVRQIDKRHFEKEGHFAIEYQAGAGKKRLKLSDRHWDGLGLLLDELKKQTGAKPADALESEPKPPGKQTAGSDQETMAQDPQAEAFEDNDSER